MGLLTFSFDILFVCVCSSVACHGTQCWKRMEMLQPLPARGARHSERTEYCKFADDAFHHSDILTSSQSRIRLFVRYAVFQCILVNQH